jgi:hypothetical protein
MIANNTFYTFHNVPDVFGFLSGLSLSLRTRDLFKVFDCHYFYPFHNIRYESCLLSGMGLSLRIQDLFKFKVFLFFVCFMIAIPSTQSIMSQMSLICSRECGNIPRANKSHLENYEMGRNNGNQKL